MINPSQDLYRSWRFGRGKCGGDVEACFSLFH